MLYVHSSSFMVLWLGLFVELDVRFDENTSLLPF